MNNYKVITLDNLEEATAQEVFNHIANHLVTQGVQAMNNESCCVNRSVQEDGTVLKCAAGSLITDEQYEKLEQNELGVG